MPEPMVRWRGVGHTTHNDACEGGMEHDGKAAAGCGHRGRGRHRRESQETCQALAPRLSHHERSQAYGPWELPSPGAPPAECERGRSG